MGCEREMFSRANEKLQVVIHAYTLSDVRGSVCMYVFPYTPSHDRDHFRGQEKETATTCAMVVAGLVAENQ